jgi:hypothetical protein
MRRRVLRHLLLVASVASIVAVAACGGGGRSDADRKGAAAKSPSVAATPAAASCAELDPDGRAQVLSYIPAQVDGQTLEVPGSLEADLVTAIDDLRHCATASLPGASPEEPPRLFIAAVHSGVGAEALRKTLLAGLGGESGVPVVQKQIAGKTIDTFSVDLSQSGFPYTLQAAFYIPTDELAVWVLSFGGEQLADAAMAASVQQGG